MARIRVHSLCMRPLAECDCPDGDELDEPEGEPTPEAETLQDESGGS